MTARHPPVRGFQLGFPLDELVIDLFAGGGGACTGIRMAIGRGADYGINHDAAALAVASAASPETVYFREDVWERCPSITTRGAPVGLMWFSPDCRHHSRAKGGPITSERVRALAWVGVRWARVARPRVIIMENVEEMLDWGPMLPNGKPDPAKRGARWRVFVRSFERLGYTVEHRLLSAHHHGAPTTRKRLFMVARRDGAPITWPDATHGPSLRPYRTAAEIIDWSIPCPSIFDREKPLAEKTLERIARGVKRFVIDAPEPFLVPESAIETAGQEGVIGAAFMSRMCTRTRGRSLDEPANTITGAPHLALVTTFLSRYFGGSTGQPLDAPAPTVMAGGGGKSALVAVWIAKHYTGMVGHPPIRPLGTVTAVDHHAFVSAYLLKYYATGAPHPVTDPVDTITTKDRFALVMVRGEAYRIVDIGMRMLQPRELFDAQGFPATYPIDVRVPCKRNPGRMRPITKRDQVRLVGNSVSPPVAAAVVAANYVALDAQAVAA